MKTADIRLFVYLLIACTCLFLQNVLAVPVDRTPIKVLQPDGKSLTLRGHGDEFFHYLTTLDNYTVVKDKNGFYSYANLNQNKDLIPSEFIARNEAERGPEEVLFLKSLPTHIRSEVDIVKSTTMRKRASTKSLSKNSITGQFKGLIILADYQDVKFAAADANNAFYNQLNQNDYSVNNATGSVKQYFHDCSSELFDPSFTVVGPVTLSHNRSYYGENDDAKAKDMITEACNQANEQINFSDYDSNHDGKVDMVYVIYAGHAESQNADMPELVWPHASAIGESLYLDNVRIYRYACSSELGGRYGTQVMDGIGTLCHEFSHVLGLPDMYDTDYEGSGGQANDPGEWSIMAAGSYLNNSKTPPSYSSFERSVVGWLNPIEITSVGSYSLDPLNVSNKAYVISAQSPNEYFYLENRQQTGWDKFLPGHGMLVFRVDLTDQNVWSSNDLNVNPNHQYYELLRADNANQGIGDPFPGSGLVASLTDETVPSMRSWGGVPTEKPITDITENNSIISFTIKDSPYGQFTEDFESIVKDLWPSESIIGNAGRWTFSNARVFTSSEAGVGSGQKVASIKNGKIEMEFDLNEKLKSVSLMACLAPNSIGAKTIKIEVSKDKGVSWVSYGDAFILSNTNMASYNSTIDIESPVRLRIVGVGPAQAYLDNVIVKYEKTATGLSVIKNPVSCLYVVRNTVYLYSEDAGGQPLEIYNSSGQKIGMQKCEAGWNEIKINQKGLYIIKAKDKTYKVLI